LPGIFIEVKSRMGLIEKNLNIVRNLFKKTSSLHKLTIFKIILENIYN